ncbi:MAG: PspA/IM30 family protein, partial [Armatimonadetes bacterium]|nr:PspA/IM30 family protein [Armatimonadota bacterium]
MGFGKRIGRIIRSNINDMLSAAEDPQKQLDLLVSEMEDSLKEAKQLLVRALADEKRLQRQLDETDQLARMWEGKARQAVEAGADNLAREALRKKRTYDDLAAEYDEQLAQQQEAVDQLRAQYKQLEVRLEEAHAKRRTLGTELRRRQVRAKGAEGTPQRQTGAATDRTAFDRFDEMAGRIEQLEAETQAAGEIEAVLGEDERLAAEIDSLGGRGAGRSAQRRDEDVRVDIELEELRRKTGAPAPPPAPAEPAAEGQPRARRSRRRGTPGPEEA